jgi:predicted Zn-dependent protease
MERINKLKALLETQPGDSFLQHALALEYIKLGDDKSAREFFTQLLLVNPDYIGSYYHLGKLLIRQGETAEAILIIEMGMQKAKAAGDNHAYSELRAVLEDLED